MSDDDAKEWVTVKVPREAREHANDTRPEGATYGDCLRAGAERLNEHLDSSPPPGAPERATSMDDLRDALETVEARTGRIERTLEEELGR